MKKTAEQRTWGPFSILHSPFSIPRRGVRRSGGFTLIEMLVVIVIIVILMGVVFKLSKGAMAKSTYAKEVKRVAILRMLIEEFHAEYNLYPPVPEYKVNGKLKQPVNFTGHYSPTETYFAFGLMSVFVDRGKYCNRAFSVAGENEKDVNRDWLGPNSGFNDPPGYDENGRLVVKVPAKDKAFVKRVKPVVDQIYNGDLNVYIDSEGHSHGFTTNVKDSWGNEYVYISKPPHTTYLIFSPGPDGKYDENDPGDRASDDNRDNIYGNLGDK